MCLWQPVAVNARRRVRLGAPWLVCMDGVCRMYSTKGATRRGSHKVTEGGKPPHGTDTISDSYRLPYISMAVATSLTAGRCVNRANMRAWSDNLAILTMLCHVLVGYVNI